MADYKPRVLSSSPTGFTRPRSTSLPSKPKSTSSPSTAHQIIKKALTAQEKALNSRDKGVRRTSILDDSWEKLRYPLEASLQRSILEGANGKEVEAEQLAREQAGKLIDDLDGVTMKRIVAGKDPFKDLDRRVQIAADMESQIAYYKGKLAAAELSGRRRKTWKAHADCCDECKRLDGTSRDLDKPWETKFGPVMTPPAHPNCKCWITFSDSSSRSRAK